MNQTASAIAPALGRLLSVRLGVTAVLLVLTGCGSNPVGALGGGFDPTNIEVNNWSQALNNSQSSGWQHDGAYTGEAIDWDELSGPTAWPQCGVAVSAMNSVLGLDPSTAVDFALAVGPNDSLHADEAQRTDATLDVYHSTSPIGEDWPLVVASHLESCEGYLEGVLEGDVWGKEPLPAAVDFPGGQAIQLDLYQGSDPQYFRSLVIAVSGQTVFVARSESSAMANAQVLTDAILKLDD